MASKAVVDAVTARLAANWSKCDVFGPNSTVSPPTGSTPYLLLQFPVANEAQASIGSPGANLWREEGAFRIVIHVERLTGAATALQWADELRTLFRAQIFDGVETFAASPPTEGIGEGPYYVLSFAVPYQFDVVG